MHVSVDARVRYQVAAELLNTQGIVSFEDLDAAQHLAHQINGVRDARRFPESAVRAGDLYAASLMDEILQLLLALYREETDPTAFADADLHLQGTVGAERLDEVLLTFAALFPALPVYQDGQDPAQYLADTTEGRAHREIVLEELLMLRLGNVNPGRVRFRELFDDLPLEQQTEYRRALTTLDQFFDTRPGPGLGGGSIVSMLRAPALASPTSLEGQLDYVRANWAELLGERFGRLLDRLLRALDVLKEERKQGGFGGPSGPPPVLDAATLRGQAEYERFSADSSWMPSVVMIAKSTFVWLDQLARQYERQVDRLDQVPDEELDRLAGAGFTGLWLIGIWERSEASRRIKQMRGDHDAVASAYSLYDYQIAADLGGDAAYDNLRDRAWQRGIRLASDMVPNHVGIDGRWVIEHPDWFLSLDHSPYPSYSFSGEDLSSDPRVSVQIEDHYWDGTDAAVVFKRYDHNSGETRFIYHGNDGTSMPWNDTAQLDYLNPDTREAVIQTILHVARKFPIIRFDAAMTLAKRHVQRLWYPPPGEGGAIPSRGQYGLDPAEFERLVPTEFWREVVDRVAAEVPDTLLLAEAFWMLEGYFVRTLGMHRVYNSAFMHMMSREDNGDYRRLMRNVLEFDPEVLKRFVNFMNNPDEETAEAQFGRDDKYFGVATVMATMPGLPMFGHGQIEGYTEKYGMEFRRAKRDEWPDQWLVERHQREIFPLLHRRRQFAEVGGFLLFDCVTEAGDVNEDVFAYSNRVDGAASLVLYNNRFGDANGRIHMSVPYSVRAGDGRILTGRSLGDGLRLRGGAHQFTIMRDHVTGLEHLYRSSDIRDGGFAVSLGAYQRQVFLDIREAADPTGQYAALAEDLAGAGVVDVAEALELRRLRPLHEALGEVLVATADLDALDTDVVSEAYMAFVAEAHPHGSEPGRLGRTEAFLTRLDAVKRLPRPGLLLAAQQRTLGDRLDPDRRGRAMLIAAAALRQVDGAHRFGEWRLRSGLADAFGRAGFGGHEIDGMAASVEVQLRHREWATAKTVDAVLTALFEDQTVRAYLGVNLHGGTEWFDGPAYSELVDDLLLTGLQRVRGKTSKADYRHIAELVIALDKAGEASEFRVDRLLGSA